MKKKYFDGKHLFVEGRSRAFSRWKAIEGSFKALLRKRRPTAGSTKRALSRGKPSTAFDESLCECWQPQSFISGLRQASSTKHTHANGREGKKLSTHPTLCSLVHLFVACNTWIVYVRLCCISMSPTHFSCPSAVKLMRFFVDWYRFCWSAAEPHENNLIDDTLSRDENNDADVEHKEELGPDFII
jgi:hypothetical protein